MENLYLPNPWLPFDKTPLREILKPHPKDCEHESCSDAQARAVIKWLNSAVQSSYCKSCRPGEPGNRSGTCMGCSWPINEEYHGRTIK